MKTKNSNGILDPAFHVWFGLQAGTEQIIRFGTYTNDPVFAQIRRQNGHEHCCSVGFLADFYLIKMRGYLRLDEVLIGRCFRIHDIPEGILKVDKCAPLKTDHDDLLEYLAFERMMKPLGCEIWIKQQEAFLLQFCLKNPSCFPKDARTVMSKLARTRKHEALFFDGVQRLDYVFYAYECHVHHDATTVLEEVLENQFPELEIIRSQLPGFGEAVWTVKSRRFFRKFV